MAASTKEATIPTGDSMNADVLPVVELPFVQARLPLLQPDKSDAIARKRAEDRTSRMVFKWKILSDNLPMLRSQTVTTLEAIESKAGAITFRIADRPKYDALRENIKEYGEQIAALEQAMRELDALGPGLWLDELRSRRDSLTSTEAQQKQLLSTFATMALQRGANRRQSPEAILQSDQLYQQKKIQVESQIAMAKKALDVLIPQIEKVEDILSVCGC